MLFCSLPENIGNKKYCTPWRQKVLTYDLQNYSSLGKGKTLNEIENPFSVWQNVCNLKFERVFDGSQVMNIAFLTDNEKQNAEINCPYKINNNKPGTLAHAFYPGNSTLSGDLHFDNERCRTRKQSQEMGNSIYFQSLFMKLVIASDCFTILKTMTVLCSQFINLDLVSKTRARYFLNLTLKQCKKCMVRQKM